MFSFADASFGTRVAVAVFTTVSTALGYFTYRLITHRRFYRDLPKPPHSLFWGHLALLGTHFSKFPPGTNISPVLASIKTTHSLGPLFYIDLWPLGPNFLILSSPEAAAIPSTIHAAPMGTPTIDFFRWSVGERFIDATDGALWKRLHRIIAPALTPGATKGYLPTVLEEGERLHERFGREADKEGGGGGGTVLEDFGYEFGRFSFEIVCQVLFGEKLDPKTGAQLYDDSKAFAEAVGVVMNRSKTPLHAWWHRKRVMQPLRDSIEATITDIMERKYSELIRLKEKGLLTKETSLPIVGRMLVEAVMNGKPLDRELRRLIIENVNGLIVAGYGTTTDAACYIFMLLSTHPEALQKLREEHDTLFPGTISDTLAALREDGSKTKQLEYTTAVIQETLRLFSVGLAVRDPLPDTTTIQHDGTTYPVQNHSLGIDMYSLHHDPTLFPSAKTFNPSRWLNLPPTFNRNAYRPFERGLRACTGQALAMEQLRIALLVTVRWFDFTLVDHQPSEVPVVAFTNLDTLIGKHAFPQSNFTSGPPGRVSMRVERARASG